MFSQERKTSHFGSQSGQAVLEYLLILFVTVGIALGVMYQLNSALKKYVQSYFGDYIACLLETGELPSLGGDGGVGADTCNASFEPFSLQNGRPLISQSSNGSGPGSRGGAAGRTSAGRNSGGNGARISGSGNSRNGERIAKVGGAATAKTSGGSKTSSSAGGSGTELSSYSARRKRNGRDSQIRVGLKSKKEQDENSKRKVDLKGVMSSRSSKKIPLDLNKFKGRQIAQTEVDMGLSIGDYIRYIIILGLIILIFIFFGGQLLQLRKSWNSR